MRKLTGFWQKVVTIMSIALVLFQVYTAGFGVFPDIIQRSVHLFFVLSMIYIRKPVKKGVAMDHVPVYDIICAVLCAVCTGYLIMIYEKILWDPAQWISPVDKVFSVILVVLILEASRLLLRLSFVTFFLSARFSSFLSLSASFRYS